MLFNLMKKSYKYMEQRSFTLKQEIFQVYSQTEFIKEDEATVSRRH